MTQSTRPPRPARGVPQGPNPKKGRRLSARAFVPVPAFAKQQKPPVQFDPETGKGSGDLRHRFIPLATKYMFELLKQFKLMEGLSNSRYHHRDDEWERMKRTLQAQLTHLDYCFTNRTGHPKDTFSFDDIEEE